MYLNDSLQTTAPSSAEPIKIVQPAANALGSQYCLFIFRLMLTFLLKCESRLDS